MSKLRILFISIIIIICFSACGKDITEGEYHCMRVVRNIDEEEIMSFEHLVAGCWMYKSDIYKIKNSIPHLFFFDDGSVYFYSQYINDSDLPIYFQKLNDNYWKNSNVFCIYMGRLSEEEISMLISFRDSYEMTEFVRYQNVIEKEIHNDETVPNNYGIIESSIWVNGHNHPNGDWNITEINSNWYICDEEAYIFDRLSICVWKGDEETLNDRFLGFGGGYFGPNHNTFYIDGHYEYDEYIHDGYRDDDNARKMESIIENSGFFERFITLSEDVFYMELARLYAETDEEDIEVHTYELDHEPEKGDWRFLDGGFVLIMLLISVLFIRRTKEKWYYIKIIGYYLLNIAVIIAYLYIRERMAHPIAIEYIGPYEKYLIATNRMEKSNPLGDLTVGYYLIATGVYTAGFALVAFATRITRRLLSKKADTKP